MAMTLPEEEPTLTPRTCFSGTTGRRHWWRCIALRHAVTDDQSGPHAVIPAPRAGRRTCGMEDVAYYPFLFLADFQGPARISPPTLPLPDAAGSARLPVPSSSSTRGRPVGLHDAVRHLQAPAGRRRLPHRQPDAAVPDAKRQDAVQGHGVRRPAPHAARHRSGVEAGDVPARPPARGPHRHHCAERQSRLARDHRRARAVREGHAGAVGGDDTAPRPGRHRGAQHLRLRPGLPHGPLRPARRCLRRRPRRLGAARVRRRHAVCRALRGPAGGGHRRQARYRHLSAGDGLRRVQARPAGLRPESCGALLRLAGGRPNLREGRGDFADLAQRPGAAHRLRPPRRGGDRTLWPACCSPARRSTSPAWCRCPTVRSPAPAPPPRSRR